MHPHGLSQWSCITPPPAQPIPSLPALQPPYTRSCATVWCASQHALAHAYTILRYCTCLVCSYDAIACATLLVIPLCVFVHLFGAYLLRIALFKQAQLWCHCGDLGAVLGFLSCSNAYQLQLQRWPLPVLGHGWYYVFRSAALFCCPLPRRHLSSLSYSVYRYTRARTHSTTTHATTTTTTHYNTTLHPTLPSFQSMLASFLFVVVTVEYSVQPHVCVVR